MIFPYEIQIFIVEHNEEVHENYPFSAFNETILNKLKKFNKRWQTHRK